MNDSVPLSVIQYWKEVEVKALQQSWKRSLGWLDGVCLGWGVGEGTHEHGVARVSEQDDASGRVHPGFEWLPVHETPFQRRVHV